MKLPFGKPKSLGPELFFACCHLFQRMLIATVSASTTNNRMANRRKAHTFESGVGFDGGFTAACSSSVVAYSRGAPGLVGFAAWSAPFTLSWRRKTLSPAVT